jgi:hypothetical protein
MSSRFRLVSVSFSILATATAAACVDPQKSFDDFGGRVPDSAPVSNEDGGPSEGFAIEGGFLLAIQTSLGGPLRFVVTSEFTANEGGGGTADLTLQAIITPSGACPSDMGGQAIGPELPLNDLEVAANGTFSVTIEGAETPGAANPISCSNIVADIIFTGGTQSPDLFCGTVGGMVFEPISLPLTGTFGAARISAPGEDPPFGDANLPDPAVIECPEVSPPDAGPPDAAPADAAEDAGADAGADAA